MTTICLKNPMMQIAAAAPNRRLRAAGLMATTALVAAWSPAALAQSSGPIDVPLDVMFDLGSLEDGARSRSYAFDVSADGSVVVGESRVDISENNWTYHAFIWTPEDGMVDLGTLGGNYSYARRVSADGNVVIGQSSTTNNNSDRAFRWTAAGGMQDLGTLGGNYSYAYDLSDTGDVVVGYSYVNTSNSYHHAFRWTQAGGMQDLGTLGGEWSYAVATNADGSVVVGESDTSTSDNNDYRAFRWTQTGGMQNLGTLGGNYSYARDVDASGAVVIGYSSVDTTNNNYHAFRWTQAGGMQDLGTLGGTYSYARSISRDGTTIVGHSYLVENNFQRAFRWTEATGMQDLGTLGGDWSYGEDVSADGSVIAGYSSLGGEDNFYHAFRWSEEDGMVDLGTLGGRWSYAYAISDDGSTIVGESETEEEGIWRAFIYRTQIQDFTNMIASFGLLANDLALTTEFQRDMTAWAADGGCNPRADQTFCLGVEGLMTMTGADGALGIAKREDQTVKLSGAFRASESIVVGLGAVITDYRTPIGAITPDNGAAFGAWVAYDGDPAAATGLSGRAGVAFASQNNRFDRGIGLEDVEVTPGQSDIGTTTVTGELSYGFDVGGGMVIAPVAGLTWQGSKLDRFTEEPGDFPADFAGGSFDATFATLGVEAIIPVTEGGTFTLGGMVETDIDADDIVLEGTSEIPGMEAFTMPAGLEREDTRPRAEARFSQEVGAGVISLFGRVGAPTFGDKTRYAVGIGFGIGF
jgi:probable HAF family extracellular repeat protein